MAYKFTDLLRWWQAESRDERPAFKSDSEAYDFCREAYMRTGGVSPDLRLTYQGNRLNRSVTNHQRDESLDHH